MSKTVWARHLAGLLAAAVLLAALTLPAFADDTLQDPAPNNGYTYTVTLSAGSHGSFTQTDAASSGSTASSSNVYTLSGLKPGDQVNLSEQIEQLDAALASANSKYYVRGIRLSGREELVAQSFFVKEDMQKDADYVVAYGIRGNMKDCTINYLDTAGNPLAASRVLRANVGDKPLVPYAYIEGYEPNAYNITKTISENDEENVFNFIYTPIAAPAGGGTETVYVTVDVPAEPAPGVPGGAGGGAPAGPEAPAGPGTEALPEPETPLSPQEVLDLDDQQTPEAGPGSGGELTDGPGEGTAGSWMIWTGLGAAAVLVLIAAWLLIRRRKKAKAQQE